MENVVELVSSLGVPITFCLLLGWFVYNIWKAQREDEKERESVQREDNNRRESEYLDIVTRLSNVLSENSKALLTNSEVMSRISDKIDNIDSKLEDMQKDITEIKVNQNKDK